MWDSVLKLSLYKEIVGIDDAQLINLYNEGHYDFLKEKIQEIKKIKEEETTNLRAQSILKIRNLDKLIQDIDSKYTITKNLGSDNSLLAEKLQFGKREYSLSKNSFIEGRYRESLDKSDNAEIVLGQINYALQIEIDKVYSSRMFIGFTIIIIFVIFLFLIYYSNRY
jgi:DNA repair ATPase RecN